MIPTLLLSLLPLLPPLAAPARPPLESFHFAGGRQVTAPVVKESGDAVWLDLGFDVLRVPVRHILRRERAGAAGPAEVQVAEEEIFARAELPEVSIAEGARRVGEAVVKVISADGQGSGFITSTEGYIVTNFHVVEGEDEVSVKLFLQSKSGFDLKTVNKVKVVAVNPAMDLALLKLEPPEGVELTRVYLAGEEAVRVGDKVYAIGAPIGLERTVSSGIVSVTNRTMGGRIHYQITAAINPGNSGGPLFNLRGQVIGVTSSKIMGVGIEGLNFAIPSRYVVDFLRHRRAFALDRARTKGGMHYLPAPRKPRAAGGKEKGDPGGDR